MKTVRRSPFTPVGAGLGGDLAGSRPAPAPTFPQDAPQPADRRPRWPHLGGRSRGRRDRTPALAGQWTAGSSALARLSVPVLILAALAGPVAVVVALTAARSAPVAAATDQDSPDLVARRVAAEESALGWTRAWLGARADDSAALKRWWAGTQLRLPPVAATVGQARVLQSTPVAPGVWSVSIAADVTAPGAMRAQRRYFQVPVAVNGGASSASARVLTIPAEVPAAGVEASATLAYSTTVPITSPAGVTVAGFLTALVTGSGDLTRWAAPSNPARPVSPPVYRAVVVQNIVADVDAPGLVTGTPAEGTRVAVMVTADLRTEPASAVTPTGAAASAPTASASVPTGAAPVVTTGQWLLTITARAGRWEVASIDITPALAQ